MNALGKLRILKENGKQIIERYNALNSTMKEYFHKNIRSAFGEDLDAVSILVPDIFMRNNTLLKSCMQRLEKWNF